MGLSDLFASLKGKAGEQPSPASAPVVAQARIFHEDRAKMFDLAQTQALAELFTVPREQRTAAWQGAFFHAAWTASLEVADPPTFHGPDAFTYLRLQLPKLGKAFASNSLGNLARQAMENISGAAVFLSSMATEPEYVISMGALDSLLTYDSWLGDPVDLDDIGRSTKPEDKAGGLQTITTDKATQILLGSPSPALLPPHTARGLYRHLKDGWKIADPHISLMINPATAPSRSLIINKKLSDFPNAEIAGQQARFLLWYFPPRRSMLLMPESFKQEDMRPLTEFFTAPADEAK